jgi:uncharacterized sulfatase
VEGELNDKPTHFREAREGLLEQSKVRGKFSIAGQGAGADFRKVSEKDARLGRAYYYTLVKLIDQQLGRILDCLDQTNQANNTLIIFTTDHGELLGDHGLWMKGPFHYEQIIRIPLLMRWPDKLSKGRRIQALFSHVDLVPTILSAVNLPIDNELDGFNSLPLLEGREDAIRENILVECIDDPDGLRLKTLVTKDHKITWYAEKDYGEFYDLKEDPHERVNLWNDAHYYKEQTRLLSHLINLAEPLERQRRIERIGYA